MYQVIGTTGGIHTYSTFDDIKEAKAAYKEEMKQNMAASLVNTKTGEVLKHFDLGEVNVIRRIFHIRRMCKILTA